MQRQRTQRHSWRSLAALALALAGGCRAPAPRPPAPPSPEPGALAARPLYTFSEAELDAYLRTLRDRHPRLRDRIVHLGRKNIGQPYEIYLLGEFPYEYFDADPIYNLARSDCLTFCEHIYAAALSHDWWSYLRALQRLRYRDGIISMLTRNHYTIADWNRNNAFLLADLTTRLGRGRASVPLHQVCRRAEFFRQFGIGQEIPDEPIADHYIPRQNVPAILGELRDGDFVNIIRGDEQSQWCGHTGLIALGADGTVNFLHSARPAVREQPLLEYINGDPRCLGIKILRLRPGAERIMQHVLESASQATVVSEEALRAALAGTPLMPTGAPPAYFLDWAHAMKLQSYRLDYDTPADPELQRQLEDLDRRVGDALAIPAAERAFGVLDLTDLRLALIQPDLMFYGASVPKICILLAYFETHPEAATALDPQVARELQLVIKRSDNELAARYSQLIGLDRIQEILQSRRYAFYDRERGGGLWCGKHYGIDQPRYGDPLHDHSHGATVRQCLRYYLMLEQGRLVSPAACAQMKLIFAAPGLEFHNDRFVRGLNGRDVTIIRKSGLWEDWHLDTARVQHDQRLYLLAGMVHHPQGEEYLAQMAAAVDELLCGPHPPKPFTHALLLCESGADFAGGEFQNAAPAADGAGITLDVPGGALPPEAEAAESVYQSAPLEPGFKFNEVVLSWNIATPAHAGFCVELRVGRRFDDSWSPWLYVGDWGQTLPAGERLTACDQGRIDVDYFVSEQRFDRLQYRIRAVSAREPSAPDTPPTTLHVERVAVCVSDTTGIPAEIFRPREQMQPPPRAAWQRRLPVPFRTQATDDPHMKGRICSPASVAMMLAYRGVDLPVAQVAHACYDATHDIYGNWPRAIQAAYSLGVPGYLTRFSDWNEIKHMVAADQPLVMSIRASKEGELRGAYYDATLGHLLPLVGFDDDDHVAVNDPAYRDPADGQRSYLREDLEQVWLRARGGLAYVFLPRRQE